jgi:hypothetical protein
MQVFAEGNVERLTGRRAYAVSAGANHQSRPAPGFRQQQDICERLKRTCTWVIFDPSLNSWVKFVSQRRADCSSWNLVRKQPYSKCLSVFDVVSSFISYLGSRKSGWPTLIRNLDSVR